LHPEEVKGILMLAVATIGLLANLISVFILRNDKTASLNIRAAYLHLLGDTLSSVAVIAGGIFILKFNWYWIDPLITIVIAIYIAYESVHILKDTTSILMQSVPEHLIIEEIRNHLLEIEEINDIHHIHVWGMNESRFFLELHADLKNDVLVSQTAEIQEKIESIAKHHFEIMHVTVQFEFACCSDKNKDCYCGKNKM
jgi:cobalt-zinc-cadmium efflux system protein